MTDDDFIELPAHRLARMSDEQLLAHVRNAQAAGHARAQDRGLEELIGRYAETLLTWNLKVPDDLREDLAHDILTAAIKAVLEGKEIEKFSAWLSQVAKNHIADFHRGKQGRQLKADRAAAGLTGEGEDEAPAVEPAEEGGYGETEVWLLVEQIMGELALDSHRLVIDLFVFGDLTAKEVGEATAESETNVYKIAQRFRDELRARLEAAEGGDTGAGT